MYNDIISHKRNISVKNTSSKICQCNHGCRNNQRFKSQNSIVIIYHHKSVSVMHYFCERIVSQVTIASSATKTFKFD